MNIAVLCTTYFYIQFQINFNETILGQSKKSVICKLKQLSI